jgi:hypothetical protein
MNRKFLLSCNFTKLQGIIYNARIIGYLKIPQQSFTKTFWLW